jgi:hypothetical protein
VFSFALVGNLTVGSLQKLGVHDASSRPLIERYLSLQSKDNLLLEVTTRGRPYKVPVLKIGSMREGVAVV